MGGKQAQPVGQDFSINHPRFQNVKIINVGNDQRLVCSLGVDEKDYTTWKTKLTSAQLDPQKLLLPVADTFTKKGYCGTISNLVLEFPNAPYLLIDEIEKRKLAKNQFLEPELWYLLFNLASAKVDLKAVGQPIGDIRPHNLFLTKQGSLLIQNSLTFPGQKSGFLKMFDGEATYMAPQDVRAIESGSFNDPKVDSSEMFSIGATLLSNGILEDLTPLYDAKKFRLNEERFNQLVAQWCRDPSYSEILRGIVWNLCSFEPLSRMTIEQLWAILAKNEESIIAQKSFAIDNAPEKVHKQMGSLRELLTRSNVK